MEYNANCSSRHILSVRKYEMNELGMKQEKAQLVNPHHASLKDVQIKKHSIAHAHIKHGKLTRMVAPKSVEDDSSASDSGSN